MRLPFAIGAALVVVAATASGADLKGLSPGMDFEVAREALGRRPFCVTPPTHLRPFTASCSKDTTFGGVEAKARVYGVNGTVAIVSFDFPTTAYPTILAGLKEKFGSPHDESTRTLKTRMGVEVESARAVWMLDEGELRADQRDGRIDEGGVTWTWHELHKYRPDGESAAGDM